MSDEQVRFIAPSFIAKFFTLNKDAADRYQVTIWYTLSEVVFKLANWMTLIGLFKYIADKTGSVVAWIVCVVLNLALLNLISVSMSYFVFTPFSETTKTRRAINFLSHIVLAFIIYFALLIAVNSLVDAVGRIKSG